jgi:hypothetical protein
MMNNAYVALNAAGRTVAFVAAANPADAARKLRRMGVTFVAVERA